MEPFRVPFNPEKVKHFKACFDEGKPIMPSEPGNWTFDDFLILAGLCSSLVRLGLAVDVGERKETARAHPEIQESIAADVNALGESALGYFNAMCTGVVLKHEEEYGVQTYRPHIVSMTVRNGKWYFDQEWLDEEKQ